jgi:putative transposase
LTGRSAASRLLADSEITTVTTGIHMPRMNAIIERWIRPCRTELLDRTLIYNQTHLLQALREYDDFYNHHGPHRALHAAAPQRPLPPPITAPHALEHLNIRRHDRLSGILHQYRHAA